MHREARIAERVARFFTAGLPEPPPAMVDEIYRWTKAKLGANRIIGGKEEIQALSMLAAAVKERSERALEENNEELFDEAQSRLADFRQDVDRVKEKMRGYIDDVRGFPGVRVGRSKWRRVSKRFKADLNGWKYLPRLKKADPKRVQYANSLFGVITVELVEGDIQGNAKAYWKSGTAVLRISTGGELYGVIKHELRHWTNAYMNIALQIKDFGKPPKDTRTPEYEQHMMKIPAKLRAKMKELGITESDIHDLDDMEFYTELADAVDVFHEVLRQPGMENISPRKVFDKMVGTKGEASSTFFKRLQRGSRAKWQKAVKELAKAVL